MLPVGDSAAAAATASRRGGVVTGSLVGSAAAAAAAADPRAEARLVAFCGDDVQVSNDVSHKDLVSKQLESNHHRRATVAFCGDDVQLLDSYKHKLCEVEVRDDGVCVA